MNGRVLKPGRFLYPKLKFIEEIEPEYSIDTQSGDGYIMAKMYHQFYTREQSK